MRTAIAFLFVATCAAAAVRGYDYASACARPLRAKRARDPPDVPCDLSKQSYCTSPGSSYPWHAIRRFIRENQGLMRRMYGEERHIAVLKAELENFIDDDVEEDDNNNDFSDDFIKTKMMYMKKSYGRAMKDKPHFRPIQSNSEKQKKVDSDLLKVKPLGNSSNIAEGTKRNNNITELNNNETLNDDKGISYKTKLESIANIEINNLDPDVITLEAVIKQSIETNSIYPNFSGTSKSEPLKLESKNNTDRNATTTTENILNNTESNNDQFDDITTEQGKDAWKSNVDTSTLPPTLLFSEHEKVIIDRIDNKETEKKEEFHPKPAQHQETMRPAVIKLRGANACETKEEMMAPFWANSTRGELLALLNMYPFEQYIHSETCVHKHKQMYCREGCRCEQQFRLHRLLAYDPRNECRGIFADWFKFPACCVCKCYDVPLEFRARSPRILHPQYDDEVRRLIYEDVARDWYTMSYEEDEDLF